MFDQNTVPISPKPLNRKNYGSIPHLSSSKLGEGDRFIGSGQERILTEKARDKDDLILVFEKYDGSNVGIAKKHGRIYALTRSGYEAHTSPYKQHHMFSDWVKEREDLFLGILCEGERLVGEWLVQAHGMRYTIDGDPIVFFDLFDADSKRKPYADWHGLPVQIARVLHIGGPIDVKSLLPKLEDNRYYIQGINTLPEGMVYRCERNGRVDFFFF